MIRIIAWRPPSGRAFAVPAEPEEVSALRASIPDAEPEERRLSAADVRRSLSLAFPIQGRTSIANIQVMVADFYGIDPNYMTVPDRTGAREPRVSHPRQVAMFFSRKFTQFSLPVIGKRFGGRDHTTVLYAMRAVERRAAQDPIFELELEILRERLSG